MLDRKWWLRWQRYTGCDESAAFHDSTSKRDPAATAATTGTSSGSSLGPGGSGGDLEGVRSEGNGKAKGEVDVEGGGDSTRNSERVGGACLRRRKVGDDEAGTMSSGRGQNSLKDIRGADDRCDGYGGGCDHAAGVLGERDGINSKDDGSLKNLHFPQEDRHHRRSGGVSGSSGLAVRAAREARASRAPHPGAIDNSALVLDAGEPGTVPGTGRRLRLRLVRGYHFVVVPQEAWHALHAW